MKKLSWVLVFVCVFALLTGCSQTAAPTTSAASSAVQSKAAVTFPQREITLVVPYNAGGASDMISRIIAKGMEDALGKPVVIINKAGGTGGIGMSYVAGSNPDGYTMCFAPVELVMHKVLKLSDLEPSQFNFIGKASSVPCALTVPKDAPYNTIQEFIAYAKANTGKIRVGNSGTGSIWHVAAAALETNQGLQFNHIPFEGGAPAVTALMGKHIEAVTVGISEVIAGIDAGKLKMLAVFTDKRVPLYPDVPTLKESGIDVAVGSWGTFAVAKGTPDEILNILSAALEKAANTEEFKTFITSKGMIVDYVNAKNTKTFVDDQFKFFTDFLSKMNLGK